MNVSRAAVEDDVYTYAQEGPVRVWLWEKGGNSRKLATVRTFASVDQARLYIDGLWKKYEIRAADDVPDGADVASAQAVRQGKRE